MIGALLLSRLRLARRALFAPARGRTGGLRHPAVAILIAAWLGAFVLGGLRSLFGVLREGGAPPDALAGALAMALGASLIALLIFDVDDAVRTLVQDADLELLRRSPMPPLLLLAVKALDAAPRTLVPVLALAAPAMLAYASAVHLTAGAIPLAAAALLALWAIPLAAGSAIAMLVLRLAPAPRARETLTLLSTLTLTLIWIGGALWVPRGLAAGPSSVPGLAAWLERALDAPGPASSATRVLADLAGGQPRAAAYQLALLAAMAGLALIAAAIVAHLGLETVLERVASGAAPGGSAARRRGAPRIGEAAAWPADGPIAAVLRRDGRLLRRNWTLLGDLLVASTLWVLLPLAGVARLQVGWDLLARLMLLTVSVGLGYEVAARSIPFERHLAYWSGLAPVAPRQWLIAKLIGGGSLSLPVVIGAAAVLELARPFPSSALWAGACLVAGALPLSIASGLWAGLVFGDPEWINPRAMLRLSGRLATSGILLAQIGFWLGAGAVLSAFERGEAEPIRWALLPLLGWALSLVPLLAARHRFATFGWIH